ncbi:STAS domain-containing protein [Kiritimatiella glycovorans]|uniref:Anti-sigma factor antagonist n=1 Tax=Kiritimatiella glycovorans TaxID=1307763 RepID=A0A0G3EBQ8_9BACT|nr:STAS domain-containing protein [Kiritimatiella glycovorans]AKJ63891.1 Putative anti-sigma factor antagonist [Kiritimatiella glycovorans]
MDVEAQRTQFIEVPFEHLDAANTEEVKDFVRGEMEEVKGTRVVLDMHRVRFVDSAGLGVLLALLRCTAQQGGDLAVCNLVKQVRSLVSLVKLERIIRVYGSREEALGTA